MKFTILVIISIMSLIEIKSKTKSDFSVSNLALSTSQAEVSAKEVALPDAIWWNKYVPQDATKIKEENEPIQEEWQIRCATGYTKDNFIGTPASLCGGVSKFLVTKSVITPDSGSTASVASIKHAKGFRIEIEGAFHKKFFTNLTPALKNEVKDLRPNAFYEKRTLNSDLASYIKAPFWRGNLRIFPSTFVNITLLLPKFYTAVLNAKRSALNKNNSQAKLDRCSNLLNQLEKDQGNLSTSLASLKLRRQTLESNIKVARTLIEKYEKLIKGELKMDDWVAECKKYSGKIQGLKDEIKSLQAQIVIINKQIEAVKKQITANDKSRLKLEEKIKKLKEQEKNLTNRLETHSRENGQIQATLRAKFKAYENVKSKRITANSTQIAIKKQIKDLKNKLKQVSVDIDKYNCDMVELEKQIGKLQSAQQDKGSQIDATTLAQKNVTENIRQISLQIKAFDNTVLNTNLTKQNERISKITKKIQKNNDFIRNYTVTAAASTKDFYRTQVNKFTTIISTNQTELDLNLKSISIKEREAIQIESDKNRNKVCKDAESKVVMSSDQAVKAKLKDAGLVIEQIRKLWSDVSSLEIISSLVETRAIDIQNWIKDTKTTIHRWTDYLPEDPSNIPDGSSLAKRRKFFK